MRTIVKLSSIFLAALASGCVTTPGSLNSNVLMSASYQTKVGHSPQNESSDIQLSQWWTAFGDPQLTGLISTALAQNLDLAQASARVLQARAGVMAATSALVPAGAINSSAARSYQSKETQVGQILASSKKLDRFGSSYDGSIGVSWEIDVFGGLRSERNAKLADYQAAEASSIAARLVVESQVADLYITIRGLQSRMEVLKEQIKNQNEILALSKLLQNKGLISNQVFNQSEANLAQTQAFLPTLEQSYEIASNAMDVLLGKAVGTSKKELQQSGRIPRSVILTEIGSPGDLMRRRPDLISAERKLAAANERVNVAVAEYYPKFSLSGVVATSTVLSSSNMFTNGATQASGIFGIRWRLFDFGRIEAQIAESKGRKAEMLAAYKLAALKATEDVENALISVAKTNEQLSLLGQSLDSWIQAKNSSVAAFKKGVNSRIDVLVIENELLKATDAQIQAQIQSARASVGLFKSLGGGWESGDTSVVAIK